MKKQISDYFSDWEGWSCNVSTLDDGTLIIDSEDKRYDQGEVCGEVIENTTKYLRIHLKEAHGIEVELE